MQVFKQSLVILCLLIAGVSAVTTAAENLRLNVIVDVNPAGTQAFDDAWKILRDAAATAGYPFYTVVSESDSRLHFVSVMNEYASLKVIADMRSHLEGSANPDIANAVQTLRANVLWHHSYVTRHDKTRSYAPGGSYSGPYHRLQTFDYPLSRENELSTAFEELNAGWAAAGILSAFHVMWHGVGAAGGRATMLMSAPSPKERAAIDAQVRSDAAQAFKKFDARLWDIVTSSSTRYWKSRIDLTLKPLDP